MSKNLDIPTMIHSFKTDLLNKNCNPRKSTLNQQVIYCKKTLIRKIHLFRDVIMTKLFSNNMFQHPFAKFAYSRVDVPVAVFCGD